MLKLLLSRLATAVPSIVGVVVVTFMLTRLLPGDPAAYFAGLAASPQAIAEIRTKLGLDKSLPEQFVAYLVDLAQGNLGNSLSTGQPVVTEIAAREVRHIAHELHRQRLVEAELAADLLDRLLGGGRSGEVSRRIAGQRPRQQEGDDHHADQARDRDQQASGDDGQHGRSLLEANGEWRMVSGEW